MALDWGALTGKDQQRVKKLFELIDADKDGIISFQEVRTANGGAPPLATRRACPGSVSHPCIRSIPSPAPHSPHLTTQVALSQTANGRTTTTPRSTCFTCSRTVPLYLVLTPSHVHSRTSFLCERLTPSRLFRMEQPTVGPEA